MLTQVQTAPFAFPPFRFRRPGGLRGVFTAGATLASTVASGGGSAGASAAGAAAGAASFATLGITAGLALAAQGISMWVQSARLRGAQKLQATNVANDIERKLKDLKRAYEASNKTHADWVLAKNVENELFGLLAQGCGTMELGSAGQRCIEERMCFEGEGCIYPWRTWYNVGPEPARDTSVTGTVTETFNSLTSTFGITPSMLVGGAVLLGALFLAGDN